LRCQGLCIEELLETAVCEGAQQSWSNAFACEPSKDLQFGLAVDEMFNLRSIYT
jgi:hypothetical protein